MGEGVQREDWDRFHEPPARRKKPERVRPVDWPHSDRLLRRHRPKGPACSVLEVGSAPGRYLLYFAEEFGCEVAGIDYSPQGHENTLQNMDLAGIKANILYGDFFAWPLPASSFDVVFSTGFIEHFEDRRRVLRRMDEVLRPGGLMVTLWPNLFGINGWIFRHCSAKVRLKHYVFAAEEIAAMLRAMGYGILYRGPLDGPWFMDPLPPRGWGGQHPTARRVLVAPMMLFNRLSCWVNRRLGWLPESELWSKQQGVLARKASR